MKNNDWKNRHRSFYYNKSDISNIQIEIKETCLLVIDMQNVFLKNREDIDEEKLWENFKRRMEEIVIANISLLLNFFRSSHRPVFYARIASLTSDGSDRSLDHKKPGFNNFLLSINEYDSQILSSIEPLPDEIVLTKTTDSVLTGTNLRLILSNMNINHVIVCGIYTDQCVSSTVRSLADESFDTIVIEDACAAGTDDLHNIELDIINNIYCQVLYTNEFFSLFE